MSSNWRCDTITQYI